MGVLVEAISVIIRRQSIEQTYPGGWHGFVADVPNGTLCADEDLARVGFMSPQDVKVFVHRLESVGLTFQRDGEAVDLAVVDQRTGPTSPCRWLEFGFVLNGEQRIAVCQAPGRAGLTVMTPDGWCYEDSLSARHGFVPNEAVAEEMEFVRHESGLDVFRDRRTGKQVYVGHVWPTGRPPDRDDAQGEDH